MDVQKYLENMKKIQYSILSFLDTEDKIEENFENLKSLFDDLKVADNKYFLKSVLYLILKISNNHYRCENFFNKIDRILKLFRDEIHKYFSNYEIFHIFHNNKRILLFLIKEQLFHFDELLTNKITQDFYHINSNLTLYFAPEIKPFISPSLSKHIEKYVTDGFEEKRLIGENDDYICKLIRKDLIDEFISHVNQNNLPINTIIKWSLFETNKFLIRKNTRLIEYAAFFGSVQIFRYLLLNKAMLTCELWLYVIHGDNPEIFNIMEEINRMSVYELKKNINESIKCHHNDITRYIQNNYSNYNDQFNIFLKSFQYHNFVFITKDSINESSFYYLCKYDYYFLVDYVMKSMDIDINKYVLFVIFVIVVLK